jgi:uncharacterized phage protein (possible DNA packaging)
MSLTLDDVKEYLRIDSDAENIILERFMNAAESYLRSGVTNYALNLANADFLALAEMAKLALISEMYENRSPGSGLSDFSFAVRSTITQMQYWGGEGT